MTDLSTRVAAITDLFERAMRLARRMATNCPTLSVPVVTAEGVSAVEAAIRDRADLFDPIKKIMTAGLAIPQTGRGDRLLSALVRYLNGAPDAWGSVEPWFTHTTVNAVIAATDGRVTPAEIAGRIVLAILVTGTKSSPPQKELS